MAIKKLNQHSKQFYILFFAEFLGRFSHWGVQTLLIFYLTEHLNFAQSYAYLVVGTYTALTFVSAIIGGVVSDKLLGFNKAVLLGLVLILLGNSVLLLQGNHILFFGLALICLGTGVFIPNNANLAGSLYSSQVQKSEAFSLYYIATQSGSLLGPIVYGFISLRFGWHAAFVTSVVGLLIFFGIYFKNMNLFSALQTRPNNPFNAAILKNNGLAIAALLAMVVIALYGLVLKDTTLVSILLDAAGVVALVYIFISSRSLPDVQRKRVYKILCLIPFVLIFFACAYQVTNSLLIFAQDYVRRSVMGFILPAAFFASAEPIFIVLLSPFITQLWDVLDKKGIRLCTTTKIVFGLTSTAISFAIFYYCSHLVIDLQKTSPLWLFLLGFSFLGLGELFIMPIIMSEISSEMTPKKIKGTLMGLLFLSLAFSSYLASVIATFTSTTQGSIIGFDDVYRNLALFIVIVIIFIFTSNFVIKRIAKLNFEARPKV